MRKKVFLRIRLLCMCVLTLSYSFAQEKTITGTITDETGTPLQQATVTVKGSARNAVTDAAGKFRLVVPANARTLLVSFVGMKQQEVAIDNRSVIPIVLQVAESRLNEVVVVGYGSTKRANVSSSIASVSEKDFKNLPITGADQAIQGKVAGVTVTSNGGQPGGGISVRIRGITTVSAVGNEPLYVIDGVPMVAISESLEQNVLGGGTGTIAQSVLATLNPSDIVSIDILKDASAQAIYGSRGANGVVIINTKRGKAGEGKISYDTYYGWQQVPKKLPVMNLRQYADYLNSLVPEVRAAGDGMDSVGEFRNSKLLSGGTDWQDEIYQTGAIVNHQLAFSGGQGKTTYYFSGNYFDQQGTLIETRFKRYALRMNIDHQIKSWFKAGISANLSRSNQKIGVTDAFDAVTSVVLYNSPVSPVKDVYGNFISNVVIQGNNYGASNNPVAKARLRDVRVVNTKAFGAVYGEIEFTKGLTLRSELNYDFNLANRKAYQPYVKNDSINDIVISPSRLREERNNSLYWGIKNYLSYNGGFDKHWLNVTVGHEAQRSRYDYIQVKRDNLTLNLPSLNAGAAPDANGGNGEEVGAGAGDWSMESYFARVNYTFNNKYSLSASIRADGSSTFGPNNRWGYFPGASASWTITNEPFASELKHINYLKLRIGAGAVGGQSVDGNNLFVSNINLYTAAPFGPGGLPRNVANPNLGWESVITYNAGIDATLFNRRVDLTIDVYKKETSDMLLPTQLAAFSGLGTAWNDIWTPTANDGKMTNKGIDIAVTTYNVQQKDWNWKTTFIFSHYKNTLNSLNTKDATIKGEVDEYGTLSLVSLTQPGRPVGAFYGYVTDGIFRSMAELNNGMNWGLEPGVKKTWLGDVRYKDLNGDKVIDDKDVTMIGNPNPKFTYGITNTVSYKSIDLSVFLYGSQGAKIFNYLRRHTEAMNTPYNNQTTDVLNRYSASNPNGTLPRYNSWHNNNIRISDRFIEDGSYLRIQNISVGYSLPKRIIGKARLTSARLYVSAQNLYTFTSYSGYDPELGSFNSNATFSNIDVGHYPNPRTFTIGANIEF